MPEGFGPIPGLRIGHAQDGSPGARGSAAPHTGCTVFLASAGAEGSPAHEQGMVAACEIRGGAAGERELATLDPAHLAERIHGLVFAGGSAFGLDAASGVMRWLEERGIGFDTGIAYAGDVGTLRVPIVPAAILFDLPFASGQRRPDAAMGYAAAEAAVESPVAEGNVGAGAGASVGKLFGIERAMKAGIGCWTELVVVQGASSEKSGGATPPNKLVRVAALAVVNAFGDVRDPDTGSILAGTRTARGPHAATEADSYEFELVDTARAMQKGIVQPGFAGGPPVAPPGTNTVLVAVATDAGLTRLEAKRVATMATAGMARTLSPAHTAYDGDIVFVLSLGSTRADVNAVGAAAAEAVARAIVRGVTQAPSTADLPGLLGRM